MRNDWVHWLMYGRFILIATLFFAFCGIVAWRNRRNRFLFFGWISVLIVFILIDILVFALSLRMAK